MTTHSVSSRQVLSRQVSLRQVSSLEISPRENVFGTPKPAISLRDRLIEMFAEWRRRMGSRRELAALTYLDIKDIGYPPHAEAEKAKPFWRA